VRDISMMLVFSALLAFGSAPASADQLVAIVKGDTAPVIPETSAGQAMHIWFDAMNSRDPAKIQSYIDRYHRTSSVEDYLGLYEYLGTLSLVRIEKSQANAISALLSVSNFDDLYRVDIVVDPDDGTKLGKIDMSPTERPDDLAIARLSQADAIQALDEKANALAADNKFAGAMIIAKDGKEIFSKAWGLADRSNKIPNKVETKFRLGSANKMFTAVAILQLVDQGKISLSGKVGDYLPDYPNRDIADKVTIRQMLTHTGSRAPEFEPGSAESYSNYGFVLLGAIIEKISGLSYYEYVDAHLFAPAGMTNSGFLPEDVAVAGRSIGYTTEDGALVTNKDSLPYRGTAAGGGYSTVKDMLKFANALQSGKLVPPSLLGQASMPQTDSTWYGYGFQTRGKAEMANFGHSGGAPGMNADFRIYPQSGVVIVTLSNRDGPYAESLASFYATRMPGAK
tara:strand:+ start:99 stop:1457 length:1359 start_codon:yes stop_codon:yes gene_type:complete